MGAAISVCFVFFKTLDLRHLDAAWYSLSKQDFFDVECVYFLDNDTTFSRDEISEVLNRYPLPVPVRYEAFKHGDPNLTQSWSVNTSLHAVRGPWVLFTRADYILDFAALAEFRAVRDSYLYTDQSTRIFVTSHAYHMAYDERGDQRIEGFRDIEKHDWRQRGAQVLLDEVNGWPVGSSDKDAGVWLTRKDLWAEVGGLDERLSAWGYQQTVFQRALRAQGVQFINLPQTLFFHQHHAAPRSYDVAKAQLVETGLSVEELTEFRPDVATQRGSVCDELDIYRRVTTCWKCKQEAPRGENCVCGAYNGEGK